MTEKNLWLITGATSGLGAHAAATHVARGGSVVAIGRKPPDDPAVPTGVEYIQADLADPDAPKRIVARLARRPSLILHSAVSYPSAETELETLFQINTFAPVRLTRAVLAKHYDADAPVCSVVTVNSEAISNADAASGPYAASKAALRVMAAALAHEARDVNAAVATLMLGPLANSYKREELARVAARKGIEVAAVTRLFLRKSNPNLVIDDLLEFDQCLMCIDAIKALGRAANGMVCRLDGGAGGSLT